MSENMHDHHVQARRYIAQAMEASRQDQVFQAACLLDALRHYEANSMTFTLPSDLDAFPNRVREILLLLVARKYTVANEKLVALQQHSYLSENE